MFNTHKSSVSTKSTQRTQLTTESKRSHVESFKLSKQTMSAYCKEQGIPLSTFSVWVAKYNKKQSSSFVPVQVHSESQAPIKTAKQKLTKTPCIEIHRGELKVVLPVIHDATLAIEVIKGVFECNSF